MIGIVVVSHSPALAEATVALADQMVHGHGPAVAIAAGAGGGFGTDATAVAAAIAQTASSEGVLVLMDLGSAVLSAELAIELEPADYPVRLSPAPLVEGLVAAVVRATGGADLATVAREAESALAPKHAALADHAGPRPGPPQPPTQDERSIDGSASTTVLSVINPHGLHARPAAQIATALGNLAADVALRFAGRTADAASSLEVMTLSVPQGADVTVTATGGDAALAIAAVSELFNNGFGELDAN